MDIAQNSITAGAKTIRIDVTENGMLEITVTDDGKGMDPEFLRRVTDPFTTSRTTRKVGMGIPLLKMAAEMSGGAFEIESRPGMGTKVRAAFLTDHIDRPPLGDLAETVSTLIQGAGDVRFVFTRGKNGGTYSLDTDELRQVLGGVPLNQPEVLVWVRDYVTENEQELLSYKEEMFNEIP